MEGRTRALRTVPQPGGPAAHVSVCLALLPSGPDAVRRLKLHRFRAAVRRASLEPYECTPGWQSGQALEIAGVSLRFAAVIRRQRILGGSARTGWRP